MMNNAITTVKHVLYTGCTLLTYAFGLTLLNQAQELNDLAKALSLAIIGFSGYLSYELMTTKDYKLMPVLLFGAAIATMIGMMCLYY
jgi:hypothetical protein